MLNLSNCLLEPHGEIAQTDYCPETIPDADSPHGLDESRHMRLNRRHVILALPFVLASGFFGAAQGLSGGASRSDRLSIQTEQIRQELTRVTTTAGETKEALDTARDNESDLRDDLALTQSRLKRTRARLPRLETRVSSLETQLGLANSVSSSGCDPSYPDVCLAVGAPDHDCAGGAGDPPFIDGPLQVLPPDPHGLDGYDNDGLGCE